VASSVSPMKNRSLREHDEVRDYLAEMGIDYERWESPADLPEDASPDQVLSAYSEQVENSSSRVATSRQIVIDVNAALPGWDAMPGKFNIEHTHDEDEVRYIIAARAGSTFIRSRGRWWP